MQKISSLVLLSDNQIIALNKPSGMPVQEDQSGDASLIRIAQAYCKHDLYPVHRLDRPTSGIVVFAKNKKAAKHLSQQWKTKTVHKTYLTVVPKGLTGQGRLKHVLRQSASKNKVEATTDSDRREGQAAELTYSVLSESDHYALVEVHPLTGKKHQIRAQLAAEGYPVRGDDKYGAKRGNKDRSIQLHAWKLQFKHPTKGKEISLQCDPPELPVWKAFDFS